MNDQAREAMGRVIQTYGPSICQMPQSAELFIRKECSSYPDESRVLVEALRHGVTAELMKYNPADQPWDAFSGNLGQSLQARAGLNETEGAWAVDAWARVLGRHPEEWAATPMVGAIPAAGGTVSVATLKRIMLLIAAAGGAAGGALGAVIIPAALLLTTTPREIAIIQNMVAGASKNDIWKIILLVLLMIMTVGGVGGAIGGALGWWHGRGDRYPWSAALAAFGSAFLGAAIAGRILGIFGWFFGALFGAFGGARTVASRGGH